MQLPQRERFSIRHQRARRGGGGALGRLQTALQPAVPAIDETDNLLSLLANDSQTLQDADRELRRRGHRPGQQLEARPELHRRGRQRRHRHRHPVSQPKGEPPALPGPARAAEADDGQARRGRRRQHAGAENLNAASGQLNTLFTNLAPCSSPHTGNQCGFADASLPALKSLGQASVTGKQAVQAATPTVKPLNEFSKTTPELAQNLSIVLADLDNRDRAVEPDRAQPGRQGVHRPGGAAPVRVQPVADDQHLRVVRAHAGRRRVRQSDVLGLRDPGHGRQQPEAIRRRLPPVLLLVRAQPAGRQRDRSVQPRRVRARPGRRAARRDRARRPAPRPARPVRSPWSAEHARQAPDQAAPEVRVRDRRLPSTPTVRIPYPARPSRARPGQVPTLLGGVTGTTTPKLPAPTMPGATVPGTRRPRRASPLPQSPNSSSSGTPSAQQAQQLLNYLLPP